MTGSVVVEFCGERYPVQRGEPLIIGRGGRLSIDDNQYLHRTFLQVTDQNSLWWLTNIGTQLSATVADEQGLVNAWLAPGARLPIVFPRTYVWFTAGSTTYEFEILLDPAPFIPVDHDTEDIGRTTAVGRLPFTIDQKRLIVALCEPTLRHGTRGAGWIPTSTQAAERLGWALTRFNRKLDNVCDKLDRAGVRGLHGGPGRLAVNRRARLVEHAIAARIITRADLDLLDAAGSDPQQRPVLTTTEDTL